MWNMDDGGFGGKNKFDQGGGGGGFLNSTISSPSTSDKKRADKSTNIVPCTIAQIHSMSEADEYLMVGSLAAKMVTFLGLVKRMDHQTTKHTYIITDHTGPDIEVQMWVGENETTENNEAELMDDDSKNDVRDKVMENTYVRVTGVVRSMKGKRHVNAYNVRPLKELNELTMHLAEVVHVSMAAALMDKKGSAGGFDTDNSMMMTTGMSHLDTSANTFASGGPLTNAQRIVKNAICNCRDERGINVNELINTLRSVSRQDVLDAIEFLSGEGHIFSTIDENHYKSTDNA